MAESEFHFKQLYYKESLNFQYMLKKLIKHHLQNIHMFQFKKKKSKEKVLE